ncbi:MAG: type II toxin-antitoxin system VapC family toxin [Deltaproteobacteria bacterium]|nr:type II toxin-antitoxin system VapC family toxin [Deltaproteobacteria bacterium]MBI3387637.1 type II toxin-antitoxin system VapC family toxin [Deltaproteobacteria bacterium]
MSYIVDASVAVKWVVPEVLSDQAERLLTTDAELLAPELLLTEVANALWAKTRRRELTVRESSRALALLMESGLVLRPSAPLLARALDIAHRLNHPVYDCIYLALAEREHAILVSADRRLLECAARGSIRARVLDLRALKS